MTDSSGGEKKIIVDEDWKSQLEAERAAAAAATAAGGPDAASEKDDGPSQGPEDVQLPPTDFITIISMLATQAMMNLGTLPNPITGKAVMNIPQAKHAIDLIEVLEQKTKGNLTPQEDGMIENLLHEMRMAFVAAQAAPSGGPASAEE